MNKLIPWILLASGVLLVLAGITYAWLNRQTVPQETATPATVEEVQRVSLADAKVAFDAGTAVFLDVRDESSFAASHIPGAVLIPVAELPTRLGELDPSTWIIPYCT